MTLLNPYMYATGFSPLLLPSLAGWYDADDAASIASSGGAVDQWNDKSGNGYHVTQTGTARPTTGTRTINGRNVIDFDGSDDALVLASGFPTAQPFTTLAVFFCDVTNVSQGAVSLGDSVTPAQLVRARFGSTATIGTAFGTNLSGGATPSSAAQVSTLSNGGSSQVWKDGTSTASGNAGTNSGVGSLTLGALFTGGGGAHLNGVLAEVIICNASLSTADRQSGEAYLKAKWGTP